MPPAHNIASHLLRSRLGKVCVAITGSSAGEICDRAQDVLKETSFLEFRLDYLADPATALPAFRQFLSGQGAATVVATCRPKVYGGRFPGTISEALPILLAAAEAGFHLLDLDLGGAEKLPAGTLDRLRAAGAGVILSHHDFKGMGDLEATYNRMEPFAPDFAKIAVTAHSLNDSLAMLRFLRRNEDRSRSTLVGICMGEAGVLSRILNLRAGSPFTFASAGVGEETAPGQIAARALLETYRVDQLEQVTRVFGVAGDPLGSSLSPLMLNAAFRRETVNAVYVALQTRDAGELLNLAREIPLGGFSVTMPLKQAILPLLERSDPLSAKIGAVNTVLRAQDGKFYGFNTDVTGIIGPLERRLALKGAKVLVLGAGGAARAAVFGCREKGAEVYILNRTPETAAKLAKAAGARTIKRDAVAKAAFDVVINATPAGMAGGGVESLLRPEDLTARVVFDLVYNPLDTPLLLLARQKGLTAISGVEMFVAQGSRQFEIWTGKPAPHEDMMRVVLHALRQRGAGGAQAPGTPAATLTPPATVLVTTKSVRPPVASPVLPATPLPGGEPISRQSTSPVHTSRVVKSVPVRPGRTASRIVVVPAVKSAAKVKKTRAPAPTELARKALRKKT